MNADIFVLEERRKIVVLILNGNLDISAHE